MIKIYAINKRNIYKNTPHALQNTSHALSNTYPVIVSVAKYLPDLINFIPNSIEILHCVQNDSIKMTKTLSNTPHALWNTSHAVSGRTFGFFFLVCVSWKT